MTAGLEQINQGTHTNGRTNKKGTVTSWTIPMLTIPNQTGIMDIHHNITRSTKTNLTNIIDKTNMSTSQPFQQVKQGTSWKQRNHLIQISPTS